MYTHTHTHAYETKHVEQFVFFLFYLIMTRACVRLSILLARSRAWPHSPPFIAASSASCLIREECKDLELK